MTQVDRYLESVGMFLPEPQKDDILSELSDNIRSRMEDRESQLGRQLTDAEQQDILKDYGHPLSVASRYRPDTGSLSFGKQLIGPALFSIYVRVLGISLLVALAVQVTLTIALDLPVSGVFSRLMVHVFMQSATVTLIFVLIEKLFPLYRDQPVFRPEWQTDFMHFIVNHFLVGLILLTVNFLIYRFFGWAVYPPLQQAIQALPFAFELLLILLVADLLQYATHRAYHEVPFLWRFHAVHHSTKTMDWIAGSRMHLLELVLTRVAVLGPLYVLGFSKEVMDAYIIVVGFQAVFNHSNVSLPWGPLKYLIVTPDFHHWHHSSDREAIDRNYAAHFAFIDHLFRTAVQSDRRFPARYGVLGDYMPKGFVRQQLFPFTYRE